MQHREDHSPKQGVLGMTDRTGIFAGDDPFVIAQTWLDAAQETEVNDANAIALSTVDGNGCPMRGWYC